MTVRIRDDGAVDLVGVCGSEDAEALLRHLSTCPAAKIDWRDCEAAHTAVIQVLLAARVRPEGTPASPFLAAFVAPLIKPS